jgi:hypothetical protein
MGFELKPTERQRDMSKPNESHKGHSHADQERHDLLQLLSGLTIHVDPANASGETHHEIAEHAHGNEPLHTLNSTEKTMPLKL